MSKSTASTSAGPSTSGRSSSSSRSPAWAMTPTRMTVGPLSAPAVYADTNHLSAPLKRAKGLNHTGAGRCFFHRSNRVFEVEQAHVCLCVRCLGDKSLGTGRENQARPMGGVLGARWHRGGRVALAELVQGGAKGRCSPAPPVGPGRGASSLGSARPGRRGRHREYTLVGAASTVHEDHCRVRRPAGLPRCR